MGRGVFLVELKSWEREGKFLTQAADLARSLEDFPVKILATSMGQNLRYLFSRDYHLFKGLLRVTGVLGFDPHPYIC